MNQHTILIGLDSGKVAIEGKTEFVPLSAEGLAQLRSRLPFHVNMVLGPYPKRKQRITKKLISHLVEHHVIPATFGQRHKKKVSATEQNETTCRSKMRQRFRA